MNTRRSRSPSILLGVLCLLGLQVASAQAQSEEDAADIAAARTLAVAGVKLAQAGHCHDAIDPLERAERLHHAPIVLGQLAQCYVAEGRLVEGTELLRKLLREPMPSDASPAMRNTYTQAQTTLTATQPKIAELTISLRGSPDAGVIVSLDGHPVSPALIDVGRPTDPGDHVIEARVTGRNPVTKRVSLGFGEIARVELQLTPIVPPAPPPAHAPAPAPLKRTQPEHAAIDHTAAYVSWTAAAVALTVGVGFGISAMQEKSTLDQRCVAAICSPSERDRLASARQQGDLATIALSLGAIGGVLGTVLFLTAGRAGIYSEHKLRAAIGPGDAGVSWLF